MTSSSYLLILDDYRKFGRLLLEHCGRNAAMHYFGIAFSAGQVV
jgi:hypothetical protein